MDPHRAALLRQDSELRRPPAACGGVRQSTPLLLIFSNASLSLAASLGDIGIASQRLVVGLSISSPGMLDATEVKNDAESTVRF